MTTPSNPPIRILGTTPDGRLVVAYLTEPYWDVRVVEACEVEVREAA